MKEEVGGIYHSLYLHKKSDLIPHELNGVHVRRSHNHTHRLARGKQDETPKERTVESLLVSQTHHKKQGFWRVGTAYCSVFTYKRVQSSDCEGLFTGTLQNISEEHVWSSLSGDMGAVRVVNKT